MRITQSDNTRDKHTGVLNVKATCKDEEPGNIDKE